jgi:hypothetical protein
MTSPLVLVVAEVLGHLLIQSRLDHGLGQRLEQTLWTGQRDATCSGQAHQIPCGFQLLRGGLLPKSLIDVADLM